MKGEHCAFVKPDGSQCGGWAHGESDYCYFHDPELTETRRERARVAGRAAHAARATVANGDIMLPPPEEGMEEIHITCTADLKELLERTLTNAFAGRSNAQLINSITGLIREARQLLETEVLEKRIEELEQRYGASL